MTKTVKNIVIVGQGAIGLLWYHHLLQVSTKQKIKVTLLASNQKTLNEQGITTSEYQFTAYQKKESNTLALTYAQPNDIESADVVLFCLKSYQIAPAITALANSLPPSAIIILANNGMGAFEEISTKLPKQQVIMAMLTTHGCLRNSPLNVTHTGLGQNDIGLLSGELCSSKKQQLTEHLNSALPTVNFHSNITSKQWLKLAINCVINPITAANDISNGAVNNHNFDKQIKSILTEVIAVAKAEGIELNINVLTDVVASVATATAQNSSSMRCDVVAKKQTEIDFINGYIHRLGKKHDIATPENTQLWQYVKSLKTS